MHTNISIDDPFAIFGFPRRFDIDLKLLEERLVELQLQHHPDNVALASQEAVVKSALINRAYNLLKDPLKRAESVFALQGINISKEVPKEILLEAMLWRERLEELDSGAGLHDLLNEIKTRESSQLEEIKLLFGKGLYENAIEVYTLLKFLCRFKQEIIDKIENTYETL